VKGQREILLESKNAGLAIGRLSLKRVKMRKPAAIGSSPHPPDSQYRQHYYLQHGDKKELEIGKGDSGLYTLPHTGPLM
jgi:hypothetical protein